jgi:hypothetical protein
LHRANIAHKECEWKDGDRGGLAEWEQTERKKKEKVCLDINRPSHGRTLQVDAAESSTATGPYRAAFVEAIARLS